MASEKTKWAERTVLFLMGLFYVGTSAALTYFCAEEFRATVAPSFAAERVDARIVRSEIKPERAGYRIEIEFAYDYEGSSHRSTSLYPASRLSPEMYDTEEAARAALDEIQSRPARAYLPKQDPQKAFLRLAPPGALIFVAALCLVLVLLAPLVLYSLLKRSDTRRAKPASLSARGAPYWAHVPSLSAAAVLSLGFTVATAWMLYRGLYLPYLSQLPARPLSAKALREISVLTLAFAMSLVFFLTFLRLVIKAIRIRPRNRFDVIQVTESARDQMESITTRRRLRAVLGVTVSFCLWVVTYLWLQDFWNQHHGWKVSALFLLVAFPLLALAIFSARRTWIALQHLSAPAPKLFLPKKTVALGSPLELRWEIDGPDKHSEVTQLIFSFKGTEVATRGQGEDVDTFFADFHTESREISGENIRKGSLSFDVPAHFPATFHGKFNHIRYEIGLILKLRDRESLREDFSIHVVAGGA